MCVVRVIGVRLGFTIFCYNFTFSAFATFTLFHNFTIPFYTDRPAGERRNPARWFCCR